ncbi:hypothetical protein SteCoe_1098 [Stentor coeruleus]|uniref:Tyrosine-protein kinase ephrin type A/B receptor-like domain-containing protein n=1 Tax=Stentor coeruleus TaxID=5963 RepID=A0A1R2D2P7_9CILI|nr:hypothetical protein SteCoe_1098 [Stentor coeruleus]
MVFIFYLFALTQAFKFTKDIISTGIGPTPRESASIAFSSKKNLFYIFGGKSENDLDDLWVFDLSSLHWNIIYPNSPSPRIVYIENRSKAGGFFYYEQDEFCIYGGTSEMLIFDDLWCFNTEYKIWKEKKQNYSPPPMINFAYNYFINNNSEYFAITGYQISQIIVESFLLDIKSNIWVRLGLSFSYENYYEVYPVYVLTLGLDFYENNLIVTACRDLLNVCDFYIHKLGNSETKHVEFYPSSSYNGNFSFLGGIVIGNYYYARFQEYHYACIDINNPYPEYWINFTSMNTLDFKPIYTSSDNKIFYFGGYFIDNENHYPTNTLTIHTFDNFDKIQEQKLYSYYISPSPRLSSCLHVIRGQIWLFGGKGKDVLYDDIWKYNPQKKSWSFVNPLNKGPSPRTLFSSVAESDTLIIWAGEDINGLNNDMNVYNIIFNTWSTVIPNTYTIPSKRKASCMTFKHPVVYIYGGIDANGVQGDLWQFNFGNNIYTQISEFIPTSHAYCTVDNKTFKVLGGIGGNGLQTDSELIYTFISKKWVYSSSTNYTSSNGFYLKMDNFELILGGHFGFKSLNNQLYINNSSSILKYETDDLIYLSGYAYYSTSIYYFGGGYYFSEYILFSSLPKPEFGKIDLIEICDILGCKIQCSKGFYMDNGVCKICPPGTYAEGTGNLECMKCPKGCYNPYEGADSLRQCYPCKEGAFNDKFGAKFCKLCPPNHYCPAGSQKIYDIQSSKDLVVLVQPMIYESNYSLWWLSSFQFLGIGIIISILIVVLFSDKLKNLVKKIDYFTTSHNHELGDYIQIQKKIIGGQFTVILIGSSLIIFVSIYTVFAFDNIAEIKTLMPLVILENYVQNFKADIEVKLELKNYGDSCFQNQNLSKNFYSSAYCSNEIYAVANNINIQLNTIKCYKDNDNACIVYYHCLKCQINLDSNLKFVFVEKLSYATGILINITSESSIPESSSSVSMQIYPDPENIFIGPTATEFSFSMTPSYFTSSLSNFPSMLTGYHVSPESSPKSGSQNFIEDISLVAQLSIKLNFIKLLTGLYTSRYQKQSLLIFISGLFGTLSGLAGLIGILMSQFEHIIQNKKVVSLSVKSLKSIIENDSKCSMNFNKNNQESLEKMSHDKSSDAEILTLPAQQRYYNAYA